MGIVDYSTKPKQAQLYYSIPTDPTMIESLAYSTSFHIDLTDGVNSDTVLYHPCATGQFRRALRRAPGSIFST